MTEGESQNPCRRLHVISSLCVYLYRNNNTMTPASLHTILLSAAISVCALFIPLQGVSAPDDVREDKKGEVAATDFSHAIDIMGFEKRLSDKNELYIIRNNTDDIITYIKLRVYYKTPKGEMLDYREVVLTGELLPNTTRHFETPSFDSGKRYFYLEGNTAGNKSNGYPFVITYDLLRYDIAITE